MPQIAVLMRSNFLPRVVAPAQSMAKSESAKSSQAPATPAKTSQGFLRMGVSRTNGGGESTTPTKCETA